jgi:hypothetical protein
VSSRRAALGFSCSKPPLNPANRLLPIQWGLFYLIVALKSTIYSGRIGFEIKPFVTTDAQIDFQKDPYETGTHQIIAPQVSPV